MTGEGPLVGLLDLPNEVILEYLLPALPAKDIITVSRINKHFHALANDETLWADLTLQHYSYHPSLLAPPTKHSGWSKRVYLGLTSPSVNVWGSSDNGRLGVDPAAYEGPIRRFQQHVNHPIEVDVAKTNWTVVPSGNDRLASGQTIRPRVVELQAGGFGFSARDSSGAVWVWGQLDGSIVGINIMPRSHPSAKIVKPTDLSLPCKAESICAGRKHLIILDSDNLIWELRSWGLAYHHTSTLLTAPTNPGSSSSKHIRQISAGWNHSACLTSKGDIHVWYPFTDAYGQSLTPEDQLNRKGPDGWSSSSSNGPNPFELRWGKVGDIVSTLPRVPKREPAEDGEEPYELADLQGTIRGDRSIDDPEKIVKISSGIDFMLALKGNGEVWYVKVKTDENHDWVFLPHFSGAEVTHITAQFLAITSYSSTSIRHTRLPDSLVFDAGALRPKPLPALEGKRIIQVASGDHHDVALTSGGEVWTWGQGDHGELGTGKTVRSGEPERVLFSGEEGPEAEAGGDPSNTSTGNENVKGGIDEPKPQSVEARQLDQGRKFAFGVTAAGWHTGALLLGEVGGHRERSKTPEPEAGNASNDRPDPFEDGGSGPNTHGSTNHPIATGFGLGQGPHFRIGFAGRGATAGPGRGMAQPRMWRARQRDDPSDGRE